MLSELAGQEQPHGGLDLPRGDRRPLVVVSETRSFGGDAFEDVVHEGVHDRHGLARDTGIGMDLLENFVDIDGVALLPLVLLLLFVRLRDILLGLARFLSGFSTCLGRHGDM